MKKTLRIIVMAMLCLNFNLKAQDPVTKIPPKVISIIKGRVVDEKGEGLPGASVKIKNGKVTAISDHSGYFNVNSLLLNSVLEVSLMSYYSREIVVKESERLIVILNSNPQQLKEVVVSTGLQTLPQERVTGSFELIDNKLFNRSTGTDVFSRLDGITTGTLFTKVNSTVRNTPFNGLSIRGVSGLRGSQALIIVDNFPYEGDPNNLNPNDVESITILKDAAAASIWGTRAGNGVIVITTKKGRWNQPFQLSLGSNVTIIGKPDLFYLKQISSSDFIDVEKMLFSNGFYDNKLDPSLPFWALTPVVELLAKSRPGGSMTPEVANEQIDALRGNDVRKDFLKYVYRNGIKQQNSVSIKGGDQNITYLVSAGYDKNLDVLSTLDYDRVTMRFNSTIKPVKNLELEAGVFYTNNNEHALSDANSIQYGSIYLGSDAGLPPYSQLADEHGRALEIGKNYRSPYIDTLGNGNLLDWKYRPLAEMKSSANKVSAQDILLNLGLKYNFSPILTADLKYQYERTNGEMNDWYGLESYYVRNLINLYTQFNKQGVVKRPIPIGDVLKNYHKTFNAQSLRGVLNLNKIWNDKHQISAIAGAEIRENHSISNYSVLYGYDPKTLTFQSVDHVNSYPFVNGLLGSGVIPDVDPSGFTDYLFHFVSVFANASYSFDKKYLFSLSARKDQANLFGVASNKKGAPLWSVGTGWILSNEGFYRSDLFPYLKLRATYGYSGKADTGVPALATISYQPGTSPTNFPYARNNNPPNPELRWEKVGMFNIGVDYSLRNKRLSGSLEFYDKRSKDLIASAPVDPSTGFQNLLYNSAEVHGQGFDIQLNSLNLPEGKWQWSSTFLFSYNKSIVTKYLLKNTDAKNYARKFVGLNPVEGKDAFSVFAYPFAGLDPLTGDPQGYSNGIVSKDYRDILRLDVPMSDLRYFGSSKPRYFGAVRNTISWKGLDLSWNISYKLNYYVHKEGLNYGFLFNGSLGHTDFTKRWQKPGDEKWTSVPSMIYGHPQQANRDLFYSYSSEMIVRGDNIRLEDINVSYSFVTKRFVPGNFKLYANVNNVGILWRANKSGIDPDFGSAINIPPSRSVVFGFTASF